MLPGYSVSFRDGAGAQSRSLLGRDQGRTLLPADLPSGKAHSCLAGFVIYPRNF